MKIVNKATNVTRTSTIRGSDFVLPASAAYAAHQVPGVVITTELAGINYTLYGIPFKLTGRIQLMFIFRTYPSTYMGVGGLDSYTHFLATDSAGNVKCVSSSAYITRDFLLGQYASLDRFISTVGAPDCVWNVASPPMVLVPVLSLTQTETSFEKLPAQQTSAAGKAAPSKPIIAPTVTPTSSPEANPRATPPALPKQSVVELRPTKPNIPPRTTLKVEPSSPPRPEPSSSDRGPISDKDLPLPSSATIPELQPSPINDQNAGGDRGASIYISDNNFPESSTPRLPENIGTSIPPEGENEELSGGFPTDRLSFGGPAEARPTQTPRLVLSIGSSVISADLDGNFIIADQTLVPGGSPVTALGKSIYLQPSKAAAVINGNTISIEKIPPEPRRSNPPVILPIGSSSIVANLEGNFVIGSQTLIPGGSPITALGKSIYLQPSNPAAVIDGSTVALQQAPLELSFSTPPKVLPVGSSSIAANSEGNFVIGSQTLVPGGSPISALGKSIYLQPSGSAAVIDGNTVALDRAPPVLTFGTQTFEQDKAGGYIIGSQTLIAGGAPITVAGTPVSLAPSAPALSFAVTTIINKAKSGALLFGTQILEPGRSGGYILGSQNIYPGQAPITIKGTALSLAPSASELIIGSETLTARPVNLPTVIIHEAVVHANAASGIPIAGQTLVPGAPPISIDGQPVSLAPGESQIVIGSSTKTLPSADAGLASLILQGFGKIGSEATPTRPKLNVTTSPTSPAQYTGAAGLGRYSIRTPWIRVSVLLMGLGIMI